VTLVQPIQRVELFSNILHHLIAYRIGYFVLKFWKTNSKGSRRSCKLNERGYEKFAF